MRADELITQVLSEKARHHNKRFKKDSEQEVKDIETYYRHRDAARDATYDTEHGDDEQAAKERKYAKGQSKKLSRDYDWERNKGSTGLTDPKDKVVRNKGKNRDSGSLKKESY